MECGTRIQIEDYAITFLRQLARREEPFSQGVALVGKKERWEDGYHYVVYGAVEGENRRLEEGEPIFSHEQQQIMRDVCEKNFPAQEIVGWAILESGFNQVSFNTLWTGGEGIIQSEGKVILHIHKEEKWELAYVYEENRVDGIHDFQVFYQENIPMQHYLIQWNQCNGGYEESLDNDVATRRFRKFMQEQKAQVQGDKHRNYMSIICMMLMIVVTVTGISMINNYEKLKEMERVMYELTASIDADRIEREELQASYVESLTTNETIVLQEEMLQEEVLQEKDMLLTVESVEERVHQVRQGDTLRAISRLYYEDESKIAAICELNQITNPDHIQIGQKILLP